MSSPSVSTMPDVSAGERLSHPRGSADGGRSRGRVVDRYCLGRAEQPDLQGVSVVPVQARLSPLVDVAVVVGLEGRIVGSEPRPVQLQHEAEGKLPIHADVHPPPRLDHVHGVGRAVHLEGRRGEGPGLLGVGGVVPVTPVDPFHRHRGRPDGSVLAGQRLLVARIRTWDGEFGPVVQLPAVAGANGARCVAGQARAEGDGDIAGGGRGHGDFPYPV